MNDGNAPYDQVASIVDGPAAPQQKLGSVLFGFVVLLVVFGTYQFIGGIIQFLLLGTDVTTENVQAVRLATVIAQIFLLVLPAVALLYWQGWKAGPVLRLKRPTLRDALVVVISIVALQFVLQGFLYFQNFIWTEYLIPKSVQPFFDKFQQLIDGMYKELLMMRSPSEFVFVLFVGAVVPAVCEELLFRGVVQYSFERGMKTRWAFLLTAMLFSFFHMNPMNLLVLFFIGFYLSFLVWSSKSLYLAMIAHFTNNALSVLLLYFYEKDDILQSQSGIPATRSIIAVTAVSAVIFAVCIWYFRRNTTQSETQTLTF
jgi:uncharacterized protein